jgi:hypothetical protein
MNSYVYFIKNVITNEFYYGSRYRNTTYSRTPEEDLWKYYFTSSKYVKKLIKTYGKESFQSSIIFISENFDECYWKEQNLIKENIGDILCLNKFYIDPVTELRKFSVAGCKLSEEHNWYEIVKTPKVPR